MAGGTLFTERSGGGRAALYASGVRAPWQVDLRTAMAEAEWRTRTRLLPFTIRRQQRYTDEWFRAFIVAWRIRWGWR
jgi:hypothetical protein